MRNVRGGTKFRNPVGSGENSGNLRALVAIVQEFGELLAQGFVALTLVADDDRVLEQLFLNVARQFGPEVNCRLSEQLAQTGLRCP